MSNVSFFYWFLIAAFGSLLLVFTLNYTVNIYGLYGDVNGASKKVYYNERKSKLLLSKNYIPANYNTVLIGPSLSDNINVSYFSDKKLSIYNASMMGAKINELDPIVRNSIEKGCRNIIICLHPYLTDSYKELETKGKDPYLEAFGSLDLYRAYLLKIIPFASLKRMISRDDIDQHGFNNYNSFLRVEDVQKKIQEEALLHKDEVITVDEKALASLKTTLQFIKQNKLSCMGYFHPIPKEIYTNNEVNYQKFQRKIRAIFEEHGVRTIDFNKGEFDYFTGDYANYIDHGHLSVIGQKKMFEMVIDKFELITQ